MKFLTVMNAHTHTQIDACQKVALVQDKYVELQLCQYHAADDVLCRATGQKPNSSQVDLPLEYVPENLSRGYSPGIRGWTAWLENRCAWHCWTPCPHFAAEWNGLGSARLSFLSKCFQFWNLGERFGATCTQTLLCQALGKENLCFWMCSLLSSMLRRVRRSRNMPPWKNQSLTALQQLRTTFFQILHGAMAHSILEHVEANEAFERAVPSRRLSGQGRRLAVG